VVPEGPSQDRAGYDLQRWKQETSPASVGFTRGMHGQLVLSGVAQLFDRCLIVFSNNVLLQQILGSGWKAASWLFDSEYLVEITENEIEADRYSHKMLFYYDSPWLRNKNSTGKIFVDSGRNITERYNYWKRYYGDC
jgi:hypothetical protein